MAYLSRGNILSSDHPKKMKWECGCVCVQGEGWEKCDKHLLLEQVEEEMISRHGAPECPHCGTDARRQKCLWEMGGYCPRHPTQDEWDRNVLEQFNKKLHETEKSSK